MSEIEILDVATGEVLSPADLSPQFMETSLSLPESMDHTEWLSVGTKLRQMEQSVMWWIGDWLRFGEVKYGQTYKDAAQATGYAVGTLKIAKHVSETFSEPLVRHNDLTFDHHRLAAPLEANERETVLSKAARENQSTREMKAEIGKLKNRVGLQPSEETGQVKCLVDAVEAGAKFGTIYADPPWIYDNQGTRAATGNHYEGLTVEQLCELPVRDLASDDAHLHLWTTNAFLFECPKIFDAWGFEFRSSFVWCKPQMGIGNYWRNSHEILLTAIRGNAKRFDDHSIMSWLQCDRGRHSAKPEKVRHFIERASPGPYLEMFARSKAENWKVWGNEVEDCLFTRDEVAA